MNRSSGALRRWLVIIAVVVMVAVPLATLLQPRPARFGWQMFTAMAPVPTAWIETDAGEEKAVDVESKLIHPRPEADLAPALAAALCGQPGVSAVIVEGLHGRSRLEC